MKQSPEHMPKTKQNNIETKRHSLSHILAAAIKEFYPAVKFGIGPAIENGFYYDFDFNEKSKIKNQKSKLQSKIQKFSDEDLPKIEARMRGLLRENLLFVKKNISKTQAKKLFKNQPYKLELIKELTETRTRSADRVRVSVYSSGDFIDLCAGPHIKSTKEINLKAFKLTKVAGAYWRGNEKNPMLTRIYGLAFETRKELSSFLKQMEEAEKRDHRKIGAKLDLFSFHEEGPGFPFWHPKGKIIWEEIIKYWRAIHKREGYQEITTPIILSRTLWEKSGHWDHYKENMYFTKIDENDYAVKPMNCPGGVLIYKTKTRSYKEFPLKISELGLVHRHERSGTLHGLFRVRSFTQDDAHIYCLPAQIEQEVKKVIHLAFEIYKNFGFKNVKIELSTRPKNSMGSSKMWQKAESALKQVLTKEKIDYQLNEGDGAFYGPKIDFHIPDCIGRTWQCGTIQLDFAMPETLDIEYIDEKGKKRRPVMLHRTIYGALERFIGVLIEHYAGALPIWLSPEQVWVIPVGSSHRKYAQEITKDLGAANIRAKSKTEAETVGKKIREGEMQKIPYLLVVGDKEIKAKSVAVRSRNKDLGIMNIDKFLQKITMEIDKKS